MTYVLNIEQRIKAINEFSISKRHKKYFMVAATLAETSKFKKFQLGAVMVLNHKVIATGVNGNKTHPMQEKYNHCRPNNNNNGNFIPKIHAEIDCISSVNTNVNCKDAELYIFRKCACRPFGNARPCPACMQAIKDRGIRKIHYTTDDGLATEYI